MKVENKGEEIGSDVTGAAVTDIHLFSELRFHLRHRFVSNGIYSKNLDFLVFFRDLDFHFCVTDFFEISINLDFLVWRCVANLFKMPVNHFL